MNTNNVVIVKHNNGMKCLFGVPNTVELKKGDKVICETKHGENRAECVSDSAFVDETTLKMLADALGATFPLKNIVGRETVEKFNVKDGENT